MAEMSKIYIKDVGAFFPVEIDENLYAVYNTEAEAFTNQNPIINDEIQIVRRQKAVARNNAEIKKLFESYQDWTGKGVEEFLSGGYAKLKTKNLQTLAKLGMVSCLLNEKGYQIKARKLLVGKKIFEGSPTKASLRRLKADIEAYCNDRGFPVTCKILPCGLKMEITKSKTCFHDYDQLPISLIDSDRFYSNVFSTHLVAEKKARGLDALRIIANKCLKRLNETPWESLNWDKWVKDVEDAYESLISM